MSTGPTEARSEGEFVPAVVQLVESHAFKVDDEYLEGLVGFDTPPIHRPGVTINLFEENRTVHGAYNREIEAMLSAALLSRKDFGKSIRTGISTNRGDIPPKVHVQPFGSSDSGAIHDSLRVLREQAPLEETVLYTVDEFGGEFSSHFHDFGKPLVRGHATMSKWGLKSSQCFWPYCSNVLLLAYRKQLGNFGVDEKRREPKSWTEVAKKKLPASEAPSGFPMQRLFWYDRTASETLACALLDALVCGSPQREELRASEEKLRASEKALRTAEKLSEDVKRALVAMESAMNDLNAVWRKLLEQTKLTPSQEENVKALCDLFHEMYSPNKCSSDEANRAKAILDAEQQEMPSDAGIYLCWYSQLRDLIKREPRLAQELEVCALPGGGFTGDWYIGVMKGSVSLALGEKIIKMLCSQQEDYKRFVHGVGLPVSKSFYEQDEQDQTKFYAWPHAVDISLACIKKIYNQAHSRAEIPDYQKFHTALSVLARQLAPADLSVKSLDAERDTAKKVAVHVVERVFAQISALRR